MGKCILTEGDYFKSWLLFFVCATTGGFIAGAISGGLLGFTIGALATGLGHGPLPLEFIKQAGRITGYLSSLPVSYICYRFTIKKLISRLNIVSPSGADD